MTSTVFVVDDDPSVRRGLGKLVRLAGYDVETFASGEEFLNRSPTHEPSCLILDVLLPGLTGLDLQRPSTKKETPSRLSSLPVMAMCRRVFVR